MGTRRSFEPRSQKWAWTACYNSASLLDPELPPASRTGQQQVRHVLHHGQGMDQFARLMRNTLETGIQGHNTRRNDTTQLLQNTMGICQTSTRTQWMLNFMIHERTEREHHTKKTIGHHAFQFWSSPNNTSFIISRFHLFPCLTMIFQVNLIGHQSNTAHTISWPQI